MHQRGIKHQNADAISRRPCQQCQRPESECDTGGGDIANDVVCTTQVPSALQMCTCMATLSQSNRPDESVREVQLADPMIGPSLRAKEADSPPTPELTNASNHHTRQLVQQWEQLVVRDGVLYRNFESTDGASYHLQMIVPMAHTTTSTSVKGDTWRQTKWSLR